MLLLFLSTLAVRKCVYEKRHSLIFVNIFLDPDFEKEIIVVVLILIDYNYCPMTLIL